jgi:hypothetical protein
MPAELANVEQYLKVKFGPAVVKQLNNDTPIRQEFFADSSQQWTGSEVSYPVHVNRNRGVMATAENGSLPTAGNQQLEKWHIPLRYIHGRVQFTGQALKQSNSNAGAWARTMTLEMEGLVDDLRMQTEFYYFGPGTGVRALLNGDPGAGVTLTLDAPMGVAGATHGNRYLNVGDFIAVVSPLGVLRAGGSRRITAINAAGTTATINAAADGTYADDDLVVKAYGNDASLTLENTEYQHPPMGLLGLIDDGTYVANFHGISRDTYPIMRSPVIPSVGGLSLDVLQRAFDLAEQLGSAKIGSLWCHHSVRRAYLALLEADRRYIGNNLMSPDGGTKAVKGKDVGFGDVPVKCASQAPYATLFGIDKRFLVRYVNTEGEWMNEDGSVLSRVSGVDAFEGTYRLFENNHNDRPNANFRLDAINASITVAHIV